MCARLDILLGSNPSHNCNPLIFSLKARSSLSLVSRTSCAEKVRSPGFAGPTDDKKLPLWFHCRPETTVSLRFKSPLTRCLFALCASWNAAASSSAFRFATSLSATIPLNLEDVLRGWTSSLIFCTAGFFFLFARSGVDDFAAAFLLGARPAEAASSCNWRSKAWF